MSKLTANRVALFLHIAVTVVAGVGVFIATLNDSLPHAWQPDVALIITLLGGLGASLAAVLKFLDGAQKSEAIQANRAAMMSYLAPEAIQANHFQSVFGPTQQQAEPVDPPPDVVPLRPDTAAKPDLDPAA